MRTLRALWGRRCSLAGSLGGAVALLIVLTAIIAAQAILAILAIMSLLGLGGP